jgi:hypothetical protein
MADQPKFDDLGDVVPHRNFTIPFNYIWRSDISRWVPMTSGGSYAGGITAQASAFVHKFGSNASISNQVALDAQETIWDGSNEYTFPDNAGEDMEVVSSSGTDNQNIVIQGLDENFMEKTWTGTLEGTTPVNIGTWTRIFRGYNDDSTDFIGDITINEVGGTTDYMRIIDGNNQTLMCLYTIPADKIGYLTKYSLSAQKASSASINFTAQIRTREFGKVFRVREIVSFGTDHDTQRSLDFPTKLQPKTDIIFNIVDSDGNNGAVNADFDIALHDLN